MKIREIRAKSTQELKEMYEDLTQKLRDLNFKLASGQLKDVREVRKAKKTIAQILTVLKERKEESKKKIKEK
jgi:ribosomal protein L29